MANRVWQWVFQDSHEGDPSAQKLDKLVLLPPQWRKEGDAAGSAWPVTAVKDSTSFSNPHAAKEALKQRRAEKQEAINEEGKKTMQHSPSFSPLEEKEVSAAPQAEAGKDSDNWVPVPMPPVNPEAKDSEKHVPVPSALEVPEPKKSE